MSEKIDETLRKIAADISKASSPSTSSTDDKAIPKQTYLLGDPLGASARGEPLGASARGEPLGANPRGEPNCQICAGLGYLRSDLPVHHPDFGKVEPCLCRLNKITQQVHKRLFSFSNLDELKSLTFENFKTRGHIGLPPIQADSLEHAYNQAYHFAQNLKGWLFLLGPYGCGKTHLAAAIANFAVSLGVPTLFLTVPDLLDTLRFAFSDNETPFEESFAEIRQVTLLVMDDFGTQNATPWAQEKLFQILNYRYINRLPTVVTTNLPLNEIDGRLHSRLLDPNLVTRVNIVAPDFRHPSEDAIHPELSSLKLMRMQTFANFDLRKTETLPTEEAKSLEIAFQASREFAEYPQGWLILSGSYGCGKTHLAAAIANFRADLGAPPLFVVVPDLMDHLRATFNPNSAIRYDRRFEEVRTTPLLILDDLGTESMTPWVREKLYQLFNYRYFAELPTVITTANTMDEIDKRIQSRFLDTRLCSIHAITAPAYKGIARSQRRSYRKRSAPIP